MGEKNRSWSADLHLNCKRNKWWLISLRVPDYDSHTQHSYPGWISDCLRTALYLTAMVAALASPRPASWTIAERTIVMVPYTRRSLLGWTKVPFSRTYKTFRANKSQRISTTHISCYSTTQTSSFFWDFRDGGWIVISWWTDVNGNIITLQNHCEDYHGKHNV